MKDYLGLCNTSKLTGLFPRLKLVIWVMREINAWFGMSIILIIMRVEVVKLI